MKIISAQKTVTVSSLCLLLFSPSSDGHTGTVSFLNQKKNTLLPHAHAPPFIFVIGKKDRHLPLTDLHPSVWPHLAPFPYCSLPLAVLIFIRFPDFPRSLLPCGFSCAPLSTYAGSYPSYRLAVFIPKIS